MSAAGVVGGVPVGVAAAWGSVGAAGGGRRPAADGLGPAGARPKTQGRRGRRWDDDAAACVAPAFVRDGGPWGRRDGVHPLRLLRGGCLSWTRCGRARRRTPAGDA